MIVDRITETKLASKIESWKLTIEDYTVGLVIALIQLHRAKKLSHRETDRVA